LDTTTLRWIIGIIGVLIVAGIFLFGNPDKKRKPRASRKQTDANRRLEPTLDGSATAEPEAVELTLVGDPAESSEHGGSGDEPGQGELAIDGVEEPTTGKKPQRPPRRTKPAGPPPEKIISLFLLASDNRKIIGSELLEATVKTGMELGNLDIFHRLPEGSDEPVFSLANAEKPGHFDNEAWNTFETSGVVMFMTLPGPEGALDSWDAMLASARRISEILQSELQDSDHNPFTRQREAQIREEMRDYDRSQLAER
jgi:cell division protein ZipA